MANWFKLEKTHLLKYQAGGYVTAFETAALLAGQPNPIEDAIRSTTLKIRGAIKSGKYAVDRDKSKIPCELEDDALALVVNTCKVRLNDPMTEDERTNSHDAKALLNRIADGHYDVSTPDDPEPAAATTQTSGGAKLVRPGKRTPSRKTYNGLF